MSDNNKSSGNRSGYGIASVLTIVFVVLKLTGNIGWSWWWVLSPLWLSASFVVLCLVLLVLVAAFTDGKVKVRRRKR